MHEFALAESVIRSAVKIAEEEGLERISGVRVRVGELQQMSMEAFDFGLKAAMEAHASVAGSAKVDVETEKAGFACRVCRREWDFGETATSAHLPPGMGRSIPKMRWTTSQARMVMCSLSML